MSWVIGVELLGAIVALVAGVLVSRGGARWMRPLRPVLYTLLFVTALVHLSELLEWLGVSLFIRLGETLSVIVPVAWGFLLFGLVREQMSGNLHSKEQQLRLVLETAPAPLAIFSMDGNCVMCSGRWRRAFLDDGGSQVEPTTRRGIPSFAELVARMVTGALAGTERVSSGLPTLVRLRGQEEWIRWSAAPWFQAPGEAGGVVVLAELITEDVNTEENLRGLHEQLQHGNRMDLIGLLASGVAHDMRNFLMVVSAQTELLAEDCTPEERVEAFDSMKEAIDASTKLLGALTGLARTNVGELEPMDVAELVRGSVRLLQRSVPPTIILRGDLTAGDRLEILGNPTKLQQLLLNLTLNSRDAMPEGGEITVRAWQSVSAAGHLVVLEVSDQGHGMPPEVLAHVFDELFTTKAPGKGTGLGLAIVQRIVAEHHGTVDVQSQQGVGTSFQIRLPALRRDSQGHILPLPVGLEEVHPGAKHDSMKDSLFAGRWGRHDNA